MNRIVRAATAMLAVCSVNYVGVPGFAADDTPTNPYEQQDNGDNSANSPPPALTGNRVDVPAITA